MAYARNNDNPANSMPVWQVGGGSLVPPGSSIIEYDQVTNLTSATALTPPAGATIALVQVNAGVVRYRRDGTNPTNTVGFLAYATGPTMFFSAPFANLKFINNGTAASLNIEWYGPDA